ncbi:MAG: response regulator [bacterium]
MLAVDAKGHILEASDSLLRMLDQTRESITTIIIGDVILRLDDLLIELVFKAVSMGHKIVMDALMVRHDLSLIECEVVVGAVGQGVEGKWMMILEIEETIKAQKAEESSLVSNDKLARAERLEMAGVVAGQIAHDFNNLLTPLLAYPDLIRQEVPQNATVDEYLNIIEKTSNEMQHLTQQLLALARRGRVGTELFCINTVIRQVVQSLQVSLPQGVALTCHLSDNLLNIMGSRDQMRRVIENLCQNSLDAMGPSGTLSIITENVYLDAPVGAYSAVTMGEYIKISIADTGCGIPDGIRDKIFDPFFTTKRTTKQHGSGLGLSIVHGIVRDHRGYIDLDSTLGQGSSFYIYLPISRGIAQAGIEGNLPKGKEHILVVDDDAPQVQVLLSLLHVLGYTAKGAASGEEALAFMRDQGERYDLIILDMVMDQGIDGLTTLVEIKKVNPQQRVILMSGYAKAARRIVKAQQLGAGTYLRKPITLERFAKAVREALDQPQSVVEEKRRQKSPRILVVDDEQMIRKLFGLIIISEFPEAVIDQASNGKEAVDAFVEGRHDLIIMDLQMPGYDGRESFFEINNICKKNQWLPPPIIFCTGFSPPESLGSIIKDASLHCLLRKPVKAETLLEAVKERLRG